MRWSELRRHLLPRSGVGVVGSWLVIAPIGNPVIRIDLRLIDRVDLFGSEGPAREGDYWASPARLSDLILVCGELEVSLYIADGPDAVQGLARQALLWTREHRYAPELDAPPDQTLPVAMTPPQPSPPVQATLAIISSTSDGEDSALDELADTIYELTDARTTIGRGDDNTFVLAHRSVSREHAVLTRDPQSGYYTINALGSTNGIRVNGEPHDKVELKHGDTIDLGHVRFCFESADYAFPEQPADLERFIVAGTDPVFQRGGYIVVGRHSFRLDEVREYARRGANLPLAGRGLLQASMAMFVVAAADRDAVASAAWLGMRFGRPASAREAASTDTSGVQPGDQLVSAAVVSAALSEKPVAPDAIVGRSTLRLRRDSIVLELALGLDMDTARWATLLDRRAPALSANDLPSLERLTDHVVVLDFWETGSDLCELKMLRLAELQERHADLRVLGVATDNTAALDLERVAARTSYPHILDHDRSIFWSYGIVEPPMLVVIDKLGIVRKVEVGVGDFGVLETQLLLLMR